MMRRWLILLLLLGNLALVAARPFSQESVEISNVEAFVTYGEKVTFQAQVKTSQPVSKVYLFIQPQGEPARVREVSPAKQGEILYDLDLHKETLRPFAHTQYWFRVLLNGGEEYTSSPYSFNYDDNRMDWQRLQEGAFEVQWYGRSVEFGQQVMNAAQEGLKSAQAILPAKLTLTEPLRVIVYSSAADFQTALQLSRESWVAGHASPELGTVIVSVPPGPDESLELERQVPHELAHILQYHILGEAYNHVPTWLLEGSASLAELYPNPDYESVLNNAAKKESLIPIDQLCGPFPRDASNAFLAYAESTSFVRYLHDTYGTSGLGNLLRQYQDGVSCQEGPSRALGTGLGELEYHWKQTVLGMDMQGLVLSNLSPYLAILGVLVLIPLVVVLPTLIGKKTEGE